MRFFAFYCIYKESDENKSSAMMIFFHFLDVSTFDFFIIMY